VAVDEWAVIFGTARRGHPSTVTIPIAVLLYDGPLLCGFNVVKKGLNDIKLQRKKESGATGV